MTRFACPHLGGEVELTDERRAHIQRSHPEILPQFEQAIAFTLADPDEVRVDGDYPRTRLFVRWLADVLGGKLMIVAVVDDPLPARRSWIVTAHLANRPPRGEVQWKRA